MYIRVWVTSFLERFWRASAAASKKRVRAQCIYYYCYYTVRLCCICEEEGITCKTSSSSSSSSSFLITTCAYRIYTSTHTSRIYNNMIIFSDCHLFSVRSSSCSSGTCYCYYRMCVRVYICIYVVVLRSRTTAATTFVAHPFYTVRARLLQLLPCVKKSEREKERERKKLKLENSTRDGRTKGVTKL